MTGFPFPKHEDTLVNLTCSILKHFSVEPPHPSLALADKLLSGGCRRVVLLVLDGMGSRILRQHLAEDGFFRSHLAGDIVSTFPPTTVAATTSLQSGLFPVETGWLGWDCHFPALDRTVVYFRNADRQGNPLPDGKTARDYYPFPHICDRIREAGFAADAVSPFVHPFPQDFSGLCGRIRALDAGGKPGFVYAYWPEPDHILHDHGTSHPAVGDALEEMQRQIQDLAAGLKDTLLLITADHGHKDCSGAMITDYPELCACLEKPPSMEPRAMNLFVKPSHRQRFENLFRSLFGETYTLLPRDAFLGLNLFGPGKPGENVEAMLGDYIAVATGDFTLYYTEKDCARYKSTHGGLTAEEMAVPLIAVYCK